MGPMSHRATVVRALNLHVARQRGRLLRPPAIAAFWTALAVVVAAYAAQQGFRLGGAGANDFFNQWVHDGLVWVAAVACFAGALRAVRSRVAWLLIALALASWAIGDTIWSVRFASGAHAPPTSISDVFWLARYPLIVAALALLVRDRVTGFKFHRWIDGVVVMLLVSTPWVALILQPTMEQSSASALARAVNFAYPLGDCVLVGGVLGVCALMGWQPGRAWLPLGLGFALIAVGDAAAVLQSLAKAFGSDVFNAAPDGGAVLVAYAAWQAHPGLLKPREVSGWPAIALPLAAQALGIAIQVYGYFHELPSSERSLTLAVLLIATVQIVVSRPRRRPDSAGRPGAESTELNTRSTAI